VAPPAKAGKTGSAPDGWRAPEERPQVVVRFVSEPAGAVVVVDGRPVCQATPCDGRDNDCDGDTDEEHPGRGEPCGSREGACGAGILSCVDGREVCDGQDGPAEEVCDGGDNDCDGAVDEGNPEGGARCGSDEGDDRLEENDHPGQAVELLGEDHPDLVALDHDWYAVPVCPEGDLQAVVDLVGPPLGVVDVELLGPELEVLDRTVYAADQAVLGASHLPGEHVFVHVLPTGGVEGQVYSLSTALDCFPEDDAFEPNDRRADAVLVEAGVAEELVLAPDDRDWFAVEVCDGGSLAVSARFDHDRGDLNLFVYDTAEELLGSSREPHGYEQVEGAYSPDDDEEITAEGLEPGGYLLRVFGAGGDTNAYELELEVSCTLVDDELEPNDELGAAARLGPGLSEDLWLVPGDDDWYQVDVCAGGRLELWMGHDWALGDPDLAVHDALGNLLASSRGEEGWWEWLPPTRLAEWPDALRDGDDWREMWWESLSLPEVAEGPYFVRVWAEWDDPIWYLLGVTVPCPQEGDDELEENDTWAQATPIGGEELPPLVILRDDEDWFVVDACPEGTLRVSLGFVHDEGDPADRARQRGLVLGGGL